MVATDPYNKEVVTPHIRGLSAVVLFTIVTVEFGGASLLGLLTSNNALLVRRLVGWGLAAAGLTILVSPIRRHRAAWHVTVGARPPEARVVGGGVYVPSVLVLLEALRSGDRRTDAEFRSVLGIVLICSGLGISVIPDELSRPHA